MSPEEYKYLADTLAGRRARDMSYEAKMTGVETGRGLSISKSAEERLQGRKSPEELELAVRQFNLQMLGRKGMERCARPIAAGPYGNLSVPGDAPIKGHSATIKGEFTLNGRPVPPKHLKLQFHSATEEPGCKMWKA